MPRRQVVLIAVGVTAVSFGGVLVRLADAPAFAVAFYRVFFAAAILTTIGLLRHRDEYRGLTAQHWRLAALSGAALAVHFATWISSLSYTTVAASVVLVETQPIWVGVFGRFVGERPTRRGKLGIAVALLGTLVISGGAFDTGSRARSRPRSTSCSAGTSVSRCPSSRTRASSTRCPRPSSPP